MFIKNNTKSNVKKVPDITVFFWILKLMTTAMGETTSDFMVHLINPEIAVTIGVYSYLAH